MTVLIALGFAFPILATVGARDARPRGFRAGPRARHDARRP